MIFFKQRRRAKARGRAFPEEWERLLSSSFDAYRRLPAADREELKGHVQVLVREKHFEGCAGFTLEDRHKALIAAQAAVLLLRRPHDYYPGLRTILVYPAAYRAMTRSLGPAGVVTEGVQTRLGESWHQPGAGGPVVLSWRDVEAGAARADDGRNVVYHEFAHQLDGQAGGVDGAPPLRSRETAAAWQRVFTRDYAALHEALRSGMATFMNPYAATSPAEFFAVLTELFFERPVELRERHGEIYALLREFYRQDPAAWDWSA